ncbi:DNRLRE domain-containing protein [Sphaerisporangium dianthi]|uniref:DNRLRE domain-containing protein n=1 Tax=Sphaerisporangium dianthi TaxID=1436120 RepID=A0ABV9CJS1_9ACTN
MKATEKALSAMCRKCAVNVPIAATVLHGRVRFATCGEIMTFLPIKPRRGLLRAGAVAMVVTMALSTASAIPSSATTATATSAAPAPEKVVERPDRVSAALAARLQKSPVLISGETTESSVTYADGNGTFTTESTSGVARVLRDGKWLPVDARLTEVNGLLKPRVAKADIEVSEGGDHPFAKLTRGEGESVALSWPSTLPKPTVKDNVATYTDAGGPGIDLVVTTSPTGVRHDIVLRTRPTGPAEFTIPITTKGLTLSKTADGRLELTGKSGKIRARASEPAMWSAGTPGKAGFHSRRGERGKPGAITGDLVVRGGKQALVLKPDADFLADPATQYPVTVDPTVVLPINTDAGVSNIFGANATGPFMKVGTDTGSEKSRGYLKFNTSGLPSTITSARLTMRNMDAPACGPNVGGGIQVRQITSAWDPNTITWTAQPTSIATDAALSTEGSQGYIAGTCGLGYMNWNITNIVKKWAAGTTANNGLVLRAPTEGTTSSYWVYSTSEETVEFNFPPKLIVTYTVPPTVGALSVSPFVAARTNSLIPTLHAQLKDADGGGLTGQFEVQRSGSIIWTGTATNVAAGSEASVVIPAGTLADGQQIKWRARANDGTTYSAYSAWQDLTVDTSVPQPPALSCAGYPANVWTANQSGPTTCTLDSPSANVTGYTWQLESALQSTTVTGDPAAISIDPNEGWHTLTVRATGASGTSSADATYTFGVGVGEVTKPTQDDRIQAAITLASRAKLEYSAVRYQYRSDLDGGDWVDIPPANVSVPGMPSPISGWPQTRSDTSKDFADLTWNAATTLASRGDGPVDVRACFVGADEQCSKAVQFTLERTAFGSSYATHSLGPGEVSLLTGDYSVSAADVSAYGLSVGRGHTTLAPTSSSVFGPGWTASLPAGSSEVSALTFADHSADGYVLFVGSDGAQLTYTVQSDGTYKGTGDATDGSTVVKDSTTRFTHTSSAGVKTIFNLANNVWNVTSIDEPGTENTTTYRYDGQGRVTRILAPLAGGVDCSTAFAAGCKALEVTYASTTTATGVGSGWGNFSGQVSSISFIAYDSATSAMKTTVMALYAYDSIGHLRTVTDPRTSLSTMYYYNGDGRISQITPPGLAPWTIAYDSGGRLAHVSRTSPQGELTQAVAYDLPIGGSAPIDLTSAKTATWAQTVDLPRVGTALFPPSRVPSRNGSGAYTPSTDDYPYATLAYLDVNGRMVDTASYGAGAWQISATRYDNDGNNIWQLSPGNRAQALAPSIDTDAVVSGMSSSADRADALASIATYDSKGDVLTTTGPAHRITLASGQVVYSARLRTEYTYDEGAPADRVGAGLVTTTTTTPVILDGTASVGSADVQKFKTGYDAIVAGDTTGWQLYLSTSQTKVVSGGADIVRKTRYDSAGREIERRMPASSGTDAGTTVTTYYTAGANSISACGSKPQWAGLLCRSASASQPAGKALPTTTYAYDYYGQLKQTIEDNGTAVRTSSATYDAAGRPTTTALSVSPATAGGTAVPDVTYTYNAANGFLAIVATSAESTTTTYDALGRVTSQTDATENVATTTYDAVGRIASIADGKGTTTYGYDGNDADGRVERRGLPTSITASTHVFYGSYDANGQLIKQVYPGGLTATSRYDTAGQETNLNYTRNTSTWLDYRINYDASGRVATRTGPAGDQVFGYDGASRLTRVADTYSGSCTTRAYAFSVDTNRTSLTTYPAAADKSCSTATTPTVKSYTYDSADRITNAGYVYDDFGRTTQVPGSHTSGADVTVGYFANDMVAELTQEYTTKTFTLDPLGRLESTTSNGQFASGTTTNHYADSGDSPAWIDEANGGWTRNIAGFNGLSATLASNGALTLQLTNPHGDLVATADRLGSGVSAYFEQTEYGTPRGDNVTNPARYGWLGGFQRSSDAMGGLILMGVRLYNPATGRFLSVDSIIGGNANPYEYGVGDPVNHNDLDGRGKSGNGKCSASPCYADANFVAGWLGSSYTVGQSFRFSYNKKTKKVASFKAFSPYVRGLRNGVIAAASVRQEGYYSFSTWGYKSGYLRKTMVYVGRKLPGGQISGPGGGGGVNDIESYDSFEIRFYAHGDGSYTWTIADY